MLLGLAEDFCNNRLSPEVCSAAKAVIFGVELWDWPMLIPSNVGAPFIDQLHFVTALAFVPCLILYVGSLNAINMTNGLGSSIAMKTNIVFYCELGGLGVLTVLVSFSVFLIFNLISGRLFFGNAEVYGLVACLLVSSLYGYTFGYVSLSFLAVLLSYLCLDFLFSILRRFFRVQSIMRPDNDPLHNRIHFQYRKLQTPNITRSQWTLQFSA